MTFALFTVLVMAQPLRESRSRPDPATIQQRHVRKYARELKELFDANHDRMLSWNERTEMLSRMEDAERLQHYVLPWRVIREIDIDADLNVTDKELANVSSATDTIRKEYEMRRAQRATNPAMRNGGGSASGREDRPKGADGIKLWCDFDKVQPVELKTIAVELRQMYDHDRNGTLSSTERAKLDSDLSRAEELQRYVLPWKVIRTVDSDGNLEISEEEATAIPSVMQKLRPEFEAGRRGSKTEFVRRTPGR